MTSSDQELKVVIVGCGGFARNYLPVCRSIPRLRVVAWVDADLAAGQAMAATKGLGRAIADAFLARGDRVWTLARTAASNGRSHPPLRHLVADVRRREHLDTSVAAKWNVEEGRSTPLGLKLLPSRTPISS
jgi:hypothetical protein